MCRVLKRGGKKISSMHYQWFLRNPAVRNHDNIKLRDRKGKRTHPFALAQELAIWIFVFYLTEFSRIAVAHTSRSSEILLCFFRCVKECAPEGCKKNLIIF